MVSAVAITLCQTSLAVPFCEALMGLTANISVLARLSTAKRLSAKAKVKAALTDVENDLILTIGFSSFWAR
jgi:hypothetical protein